MVSVASESSNTATAAEDPSARIACRMSLTDFIKVYQIIQYALENYTFSKISEGANCPSIKSDFRSRQNVPSN